jgi:hypothetical protein
MEEVEIIIREMPTNIVVTYSVKVTTELCPGQSMADAVEGIRLAIISAVPCKSTITLQSIVAKLPDGVECKAELER